MKPYPVFLVGLERRQAVVVGGGHEAERKIRELLDCDARVTLIARDSTPGLNELAREGRIGWKRRSWRSGDTHGAFVVIATERDDPDVDAIAREAQADGALVNVMDDVGRCNFVGGSVVRRGPLCVAISTSGHAPALAVRLRQKLERELGEEYESFLRIAGELRATIARECPDPGRRRQVWYALVDSVFSSRGGFPPAGSAPASSE